MTFPLNVEVVGKARNSMDSGWSAPAHNSELINVLLKLAYPPTEGMQVFALGNEAVSKAAARALY